MYSFGSMNSVHDCVWSSSLQEPDCASVALICRDASVDISLRCCCVEKTTPFGLNLMRSQVLYLAAHQCVTCCERCWRLGILCSHGGQHRCTCHIVFTWDESANVACDHHCDCVSLHNWVTAGWSCIDIAQHLDQERNSNLYGQKVCMCISYTCT